MKGNLFMYFILDATVSTTKISLNLNSRPQGLSDDMKSTIEQLLLFIQQDESSLPGPGPSHNVDGAVEVSSSTGELVSIKFL